MRSSCGRWRWSIIRTVGGSIQTVFRSRVFPSHWTRTGSPAKGPDEPVQGRGLHVPFHVPGEGVVVHRLLVDLRELLGEAGAPPVPSAGRDPLRGRGGPEPVGEPGAAVPPLVLLLEGDENPRGVHGGSALTG